MLKRIISIFLFTITILTLSACGNSNDNSEKDLSATSVNFAQNGQYKSTISATGIDLSKISLEKAEVRYANPYGDTIDANSLIKNLTGNYDNELVLNNSFEETYPFSATVNEVKNLNDHQLSIGFTDQFGLNLLPNNYVVKFKDIDDIAIIDVNYENVTLTANPNIVYPSQKEILLTLLLNGDEFVDKVEREHLILGNAFEKMNVEVLSNTKKNLVIKLSGNLTRNVAGAYQWGKIGVKPEGLKNGYTDVYAQVDVELDYLSFDTSSLKYNDGKITANLLCYGIDIDGLTKENITIPSITINDIEKTEENIIKVTMSSDGINSVNDFVELVNGKTMNIGEYEEVINISQTNFFSTLDFAEKNGDNLELSFNLYIFGGYITNNISANNFILDGGFEGATVASVKYEDKDLASIKIVIPGKDINSSNFTINGKIEIDKNAIYNTWGEKPSINPSYTKEYVYDSNKSPNLQYEDLMEIQKFTRGLNTTFGAICYYGGIIGQVISIGKTILEVTGAIKSNHVQVMETLEEIKQKLQLLDTIVSEIAEVKKELKEVSEKIQQDRINEFENTKILFYSYLNDVKKVHERAALDLALIDAVNRGNLDELPSYKGMSQAEIAAYNEELAKLYLPNVEDMTDTEAIKYNVRIMNYISEMSKDVDNPQYSGYTNAFNKLDEYFKLIVGQLGKPTDSNPISFYDELCSKQYNFDSQTYEFRLAIREELVAKLSDAMWAFAFHYKISDDPYNTFYSNKVDEYKKALDMIEKMPVTGHSPSEIKALREDIVEKTVGYATLISDVYLVASNSREKCLNWFQSNGWKWIDKDLNQGAGGDYIYLGYKTTNDPHKAIKDLYIYNDDNLKRDGWSLVNHTGIDTSFDGDLNDGASGRYIYLYYSRTEYGASHYFSDPDEARVAEIIISEREWSSAESYEGNYVGYAVPHGGGLKGDLNQGAPGSHLWMYIKYKEYPFRDTTTTEKVVGKSDGDPNYYPYCYALGAKVAIQSVRVKTTDNLLNIIKSGLYKKGTPLSNWTDKQIEEFVSRMHYNDIYQELKSAGINVKDGPNVILTVKNQGEKIKLGNDHYRIKLPYKRFDKRAKGKVVDTYLETAFWNNGEYDFGDDGRFYFFDIY